METSLDQTIYPDNSFYDGSYENLVYGVDISIEHGNSNMQQPFEDDLSIQLAQYGMTKDSIPY